MFVTNLFLTNMFARVQAWHLKPVPPSAAVSGPPSQPLTREGIVAAAVRIMQAEGLDRVTMRRLAQELDTGPASLYVYVRNTAELHAAMLEELLGQVDLTPVTAAGDWRDRLTRSCSPTPASCSGSPAWRSRRW